MSINCTCTNSYAPPDSFKKKKKKRSLKQRTSQDPEKRAQALHSVPGKLGIVLLMTSALANTVL